MTDTERLIERLKKVHRMFAESTFWDAQTHAAAISEAIQALSDQGPRKATLPPGYSVALVENDIIVLRKDGRWATDVTVEGSIGQFLSAFLTTDKADDVSSVGPVNWPGKLRDWVDEHPEHLVTRSELEVWLNRYISSATKQGDSNG